MNRTAESNLYWRHSRRLVLIATILLLSTVLYAQSVSLAIPNQVPTSAQNPVYGSVPDAKPTPGTLSLTFSEAINRALQHNLAGLLSEYNTIQARGEKWEQLSDLLPHVNGDVQEVAEKESLAALGFGKFPSSAFGGASSRTSSVPSPISMCAASATQRIFDWKAIQKYRSSVIGESVARFNLKDARDLVVLATGNAYLEAIAGAARVETAQAQVDTAKALYDKAVAQQQAGVAPAIDTLRAQVEYQSRQQQLIAADQRFRQAEDIVGACDRTCARPGICARRQSSVRGISYARS